MGYRDINQEHLELRVSVFLNKDHAYFKPVCDKIKQIAMNKSLMIDNAIDLSRIKIVQYGPKVFLERGIDDEKY